MANLPFFGRGSTRRILTVVALLIITFASSAYAAEFRPIISLAQYYTDNLFLLPDELKEADWVTEVRPGIKINHESSRIIFDLDYAYQALFYADNDQFNEGYHQLDSSASVDLVGDELRLFASANATQVNIRPQGTQSPSNIPVTGNRSDANTLSIGPRWTRQLFLGSEIDAYAYTGKTSFDNPLTQDFVPVRVGVTLQPSDPAYRTRYRVNYRYVSLDYEISEAVVNQELNLELARDVSDSTALTALVGLESDLNDPLDDSLSEWRWEVGFNTGTGENSFSAAIGERYFGTNVRVQWLRSSPKNSFSLGYREDPENGDNLDLQRIPTEPTDPDAPPPPPDPDSGLNRRGAPGRFINKRFDTSLSLFGHKTTVTLTGFYEDRISLIEDIPDTDGYGVVFDFSRSLGIRTDFTSNIAWYRRQAFLTDPDTGLQISQGERGNFFVSANLSRLFGTATTIALGVNYDVQEDPGRLTQDFEAVLIMLSLTRAFGRDAN